MPTNVRSRPAPSVLYRFIAFLADIADTEANAGFGEDLAHYRAIYGAL